MKRTFLSIGVFVLSTFAVWAGSVASVMAANPSEVVIFSCVENIPPGGYSVINYDGTPAKSSSDCATELEALLNAGLTNVNVTVQTYIYTDTTTGGAPGGVAGTYITYVLTNGTLSSGNL
jgi:hypothetical protein